jgi:hypothetical protein
MEWLVFIVVAIIVWAWIRQKSPGSPAERRQSTDTPNISVTLTTFTSAGGGYENRPINVGDLVEDDPAGWVLNPKSPLPLTVCNAGRDVASRLKTLLGAAEYWTQKVPDVALLIAQHNLRFKQVDAFVAEHRSKYHAEVTRLTSNSPEWAQASKRDRGDLLADFKRTALESLRVYVGRVDFECLLEGEPATFIEDDALVKRFEGNSSLYSLYLSLLNRRSQVFTVKAEDYNRKAWEELVERGFARRGKDIPIDLILEGLRLKDLNELLSGVVSKPLGRKAKAIEAAMNLPDLHSRLSERITYREMFQVLPPSDIDVDQLGRSFAYATALAAVVQQTYYTGVRTLEAIAERKREPGVFDAWEIRHWEDPIPACAAAVCKKYDRLPAKRPPLHVGCNCQLEPSFKE